MIEEPAMQNRTERATDPYPPIVGVLNVLNAEQGVERTALKQRPAL